MKLLLVALAWPVSCVHHLWNNRPPCKVDWFVFYSQKQDVQWYIADTGNMLALSMLLAAFWMSAQNQIIKWLTGTLTIISIIDIVHYWLCYNQLQEIVFLQGIMMIAASIKAFLLTCKNISKSGKPYSQ